MGHHNTGDVGFGLGALSQNLDLERCAMALPDEGFGVFDGVHLLPLVGIMLAGQPISIKMSWPEAC